MLIVKQEGGRMALAIHLICRLGPNGMWPDNVTNDPTTRVFTSGYWDLSVEDAERLVGGWLYLHTAKAKPSYFGGSVSGFERVVRDDVARANRIALKFHPSAFGRGQNWRGHDHSRTWTSGLIRAGLSHEAGERHA
jgi:hypothetical protein